MPLTPLTNPITTVGRVAYNARRDGTELRKRRRGHDSQTKVYSQGPASKAVVAAEAFSIHPHDLLLMNRSHKKRKAGHTNDTDIHVMSSANLACIDQGSVSLNASTEEKIEAYRDGLVFGGVATNAARYDEFNNHNEETFAAQFGGLATMVNTGKETILAGDFIIWDLPSSDVRPNQYKHAPKSKALFVTKRLGMESFEEGAARVTAAAANALSADQLYRDMCKEHYKLTQRCIGRAMSNARANESFDILLGNYCA